MRTAVWLLVLSLSLAAAPVDPALLKPLRYRNVGPHRGGRVTAITGVRSQAHTFYMGATGGGLWKTTNAGHTWTPIADGQIPNGSIGAVAVAESDPGTVYVGTGSAAIRSNVIHGRGMYKSTDAGKTWQFAGLRNAGQIGSIRVHPKDANTVYVAALGQPFVEDRERLAFDPAERGVFRSRDGGKTWQHVLKIDAETGVVSLSMNPENPAEIYAGAWRAQRKPWTIVSGGPAKTGGIYKTTDGGDTWRHLENGLPQTLIGKVDVEVSPARPSRVYAILEAPGNEAGVYRSDDSGATWKQVSSQQSLIRRPFYYTYIDADPKDADTVWVNNLGLHKSSDGGATWRTVATPHGDNHGLWIHPDHPQIMIQSNDGGATVSLNGGQNWSTIYNQPTAEIYQVAVDQQTPYRIYGAQQDNSTLIVPSLPPRAGRADDPIQLWMNGPGCETGPVLPHPTNADIVYGSCKGEFSRLSLKTGQEKTYWTHPQNRYGHAARDIKFRHQRVSPIEISPHNPRVIYFGSQFVHRTTDEGVTWQIVSPDLTANEPGVKQGISGEPITRDITGEEVYSTLYAIRESPTEAGVIWTGANDGPFHVSRDNGKTWKNVTPKDLPPGGRVQNIEPSPHRKGSAYFAVYRYLLGDFRPYIYRTDDYGATWRRTVNGIPEDVPVRVVREDPGRQGLLYAGTEFGMYVSFDNGENWQSFQLNLPVTPVTDIRVHRKDLVLSTMGRAFWILDDLSPLHQLGAALEGKAGLHLFAPRAATRLAYASGGRRTGGGPEYPPNGARIDYYLPTNSENLRLEILNAKGEVVRRFPSDTPAAPPRATSMEDEDAPPARGGAAAMPLPKTAGMHRFVWDLRHGKGPLAPPGKYQVRLTANNETRTQPLTIEADPRVLADGVTQADMEEQYALQLQIRDVLEEARALAKQVEGKPALHARLVTARGPYPQPMLIDQLQSTLAMVSGADMKVGRVAFEYLAELRKELEAIRAEAR
ncbi:MAG: hypothetical protein SFV54_23165 [Bryobacteraceae bacterium]|nr:hypothetical protein [Bryobacteraceae bacterium]